jgi:hypothetical protein
LLHPDNEHYKKCIKKYFANRINFGDFFGKKEQKTEEMGEFF